MYYNACAKVVSCPCPNPFPRPRFPEMSCKTSQSSRKLPAVPEAVGFRLPLGSGHKCEGTFPDWADMIFPQGRGVVKLLAERRRLAESGEAKFVPWEEARALLEKEEPSSNCMTAKRLTQRHGGTEKKARAKSTKDAKNFPRRRRDAEKEGAA